MSRRTGQSGHIEESGKWWVVRWWMDVAGQEKRVHKRARICPVSGPGVLSRSARGRRAREIITGSGADTEEYFNKVVKLESGITFREQAMFWFEQVGIRKRKPVAVSTLELWEGCLRNWLNPQIGELPLSEINNDVERWIISENDRQLCPSSQDGRGICSKQGRRGNPPEKVEPRIHGYAHSREGKAEYSLLLTRHHVRSRNLEEGT